MDTADTEEQTTVKVVIRVRPLNQREIDGSHESVWNIDSSDGVISQADGSVARNYAFDRVFAPTESTKQIYTESILPMIKSFVAGFNGTIFAYGQTSSGKTYTMMGSGAASDDGIIHRCIKHIFSAIRKTPGREFSIKVSYLEIYNESIKDLLDPSNLDLKISMDALHRPYVRNLTQQCPLGADDTFRLLTQGMQHRNIGSTKMNDQSSRSHTLFQIALESRPSPTQPLLDDDANDANAIDTSVRSSILNIVDLAGSERAKKTDAKGQRLKEGGHINKSLLVLGIIIKKLSELSRSNDGGQQHIPYRDSKLTHILEPALGGNSKTVVICTMTPADIHAEESVSTLGFASRAKEVKNCATVVELRDDASVIRQQRRQIQQLQRQLRVVQTTQRPTANANGDGDGDGDGEGETTMPMHVVADLDVEMSGFEAERKEYKRTIDRLKQLCKASTDQQHILDDDVDADDDDDDDGEDEDDDLAHTKPNKSSKRQQRSLEPLPPPSKSASSSSTEANASRKRRHSVAFDFSEGSPARKRQRKQLTRHQAHPQQQHVHQLQLSTPMNRARMEKEAVQWKLAEANHIKQSLQHELQLNYREFTAMQSETQRLREKCEFLEHTLQAQYSNPDVVLENERLHSQVRTLTSELQRDTHADPQRLRAELSTSQGTIRELEAQISALRVNIEQQSQITERQLKAKESTPEQQQQQPHVQSASLLRVHLHKLQSQIVLLQDDRRCMRQSLHGEQQRVAQFAQSITLKLAALRQQHERIVDEKRSHEAQSMELHQECRELRDELALCRRDPNELLHEAQSELLTTQKQYDIDAYHHENVKRELEFKSAAIADLKQTHSHMEANAAEREHEVVAEYEQKLTALQHELAQMKTAHDTLENASNSAAAAAATATTKNSKLDNMNAAELKNALKTAKKGVRDVQSKLGAMERKKELHEKNASKLNKKHNELLQRHKLAKRECGALRSKLQSTEQSATRLESKTTKQLETIQKLQKEMVNGKEATRKIGMLQKQVASVQQKHAKLDAEHQRLQAEHERNCAQMTTLQAQHSAVQDTAHATQQTLTQLQQQHGELEQQRATEKAVSERFKLELTKYHQLNGDQRNQLVAAQDKITAHEQTIAALQQVQAEHATLQSQHSRVTTAFDESERKLKELEATFAQLKQSESTQKHELAETNQMCRELQSELQSNKHELAAYTNRWQTERASNERAMQQVRQFELKTNHLTKELEMSAAAVTNKNAELERLSAQCKQQQNELCSVRSECDENKTLSATLQNEVDKLQHSCDTLTQQKQEHERVIAETEHALATAETKLESVQREFEQTSRARGESEHKLQTLSGKFEELQVKHDSLRQEQKEQERALDEKESENLELNEEIEDLHIQFETERKRKQKELDALTEKFSNVQRECDLKRTELEMVGEVEKRKNELELQYTQLVTKSESTAVELKSTHQKLEESGAELENAKLKNAHITLQNERLRDDLNAVSNSSDLDVLKRKYVKAKEELSKRAEMIEKIKERETRHVDKCRDAIGQWEKHCKNLEEKIETQNEELQRLRPSQTKNKKFEKLCKEYHFARSMVEKAAMVCRQTQTDEIRMNGNKENTNPTH